MISKEGEIKLIRSNSIYFEVKRRFFETDPGQPKDELKQFEMTWPIIEMKSPGCLPGLTF